MDGQCFPFLLLLLPFTVAVGLDTYSGTMVTPYNVSVERANWTVFLNGSTVVEVYSHMALRCWNDFALQMDNVSKEHWCEWKSIVRAYNHLRDCLEGWADELRYSYPNALAVDYTMRSHRTYFLNCSLERPPLLDPPENVLLTLIIAPICLIPFLVILVVLKSKDGEMQS